MVVFEIKARSYLFKLALSLILLILLIMDFYILNSLSSESMFYIKVVSYLYKAILTKKTMNCFRNVDL